MIALSAYDAVGDPCQVPLTKVPLWIQIYNLPFAGRTEVVAKSIGNNSFGGFLDWDKSEASRYGSFFRIRAWVKVEAPLRRGQMIAPATGYPVRVKFKYEKLINFCYRCGRLDHVQRECDAKGNKLPFGPWLRADGDRYLAPRWRGVRGGLGRDSKAMAAIETEEGIEDDTVGGGVGDGAGSEGGSVVAESKGGEEGGSVVVPGDGGKEVARREGKEEAGGFPVFPFPGGALDTSGKGK